jgi:hypothetical protein
VKRGQKLSDIRDQTAYGLLRDMAEKIEMDEAQDLSKPIKTFHGPPSRIRSAGLSPPEMLSLHLR